MADKELRSVRFPGLDDRYVVPDAPSKRWFDAIQDQIGDLSELTTKAKENLVAAINEAAKSGLPEITEATKDMALYNDGEKAEWRHPTYTSVYYWNDRHHTNDLFFAQSTGACGCIVIGESPVGVPCNVMFGGVRYGYVTLTILSPDGGVYSANMDLGNQRISDPVKMSSSSLCVAITQNDDDTYSSDHTYAEIKAAYDVGKYVYAMSNGNIVPLSAILDGIVRFTISILSPKNDDYEYEIVIDQNGGVSVTGRSLVMVGASNNASGDSGLVPMPGMEDKDKFLRGDGTWADVDGGVSLGITGAAVGQIAKITAVDTDGKPTAWEPVDMVGGGKKAWTKIIDADVTETTGSFRAEGLANVTEFDILWSNLQNASTVDSGLNVIINNIAVTGNSSAVIVSKSGSSRYGWTRLTYDGLFWHVQKSGGAVYADNTVTNSTIYATYNLVRDVGAATTFALGAPTMNYAPVSGKLEVWAR